MIEAYRKENLSDTSDQWIMIQLMEELEKDDPNQHVALSLTYEIRDRWGVCNTS